MTNQGVKFYKFSNSTSSADKIASAKATEGAVIYLVDVRELWIGGSTPKLVIKGANDVTFSSNVLTITHYDNAGTATTQTLDFSDVASASSTMAVFTALYEKMGLTGTNHDTIDYSGTNYLSDLGTTGHPDKNLVNADKALDAAIHEATLKDGTTGAVYDTTAQEISQTWITTVNTNAIADNETLNTSVNKLDIKIAGLADELIRDEQVTQEAFTAVSNSVGLESDMSLNLSSDQTGIISSDTTVKSALLDLADAVDNAGQVDDVKIIDDNGGTGTSIVTNKIANIAVDGTYNASTNKIATVETVTDAIGGLDVTEYAQATIDTTTTSGETAFKVKGIKEVDGKIEAGTNTVDLKIDGTYNASTNMIATESTVSSAIDAIAGAGLAVDNAGVITATTQSTSDDSTNVATTAFVHDFVETLDTQNDVQAVDYTAATSSTGAKLTFKGVSETDGVIAQGSGATELQFAKVATTGAASDVSYTNTTSGMTATDVQGAIDELDGRVDSLVGGMRYNGDISTASATVNTTTGDVRPGDIYLASGAFTIGTTSVEAGDMIVYKGTTSQSAVALDGTNCTIIERETDTMVTAGGTLTDDYVVFGNGNKEVTTTSNDSYTISASDLNTAITKANSALQSISRGTDGTYVTTTIGSKDSNNDQSVGVALTEGTVTYTAKSGSTPANLSVTSGDEGVLTTDAVTPIKNYVDATVSDVVSDLDVAEYQQASVDVDSTNHTSTLKIKGIKEDDGKIAAATTTPTTDVEIDGEYNASTNKIATKSTVTNAINALDANPTSDDAAVATVQVVETDGVITDVVVTNVSAGVSYTASTPAQGSTPGTAANLAATTSTGAVTGADIATIKSYVDDVAALRWEEYE